MPYTHYPPNLISILFPLWLILTKPFSQVLGPSNPQSANSPVSSTSFLALNENLAVSYWDSLVPHPLSPLQVAPHSSGRSLWVPSAPSQTTVPIFLILKGPRHLLPLLTAEIPTTCNHVPHFLKNSTPSHGNLCPPPQIIIILCCLIWALNHEGGKNTWRAVQCD